MRRSRRRTYPRFTEGGVAHARAAQAVVGIVLKGGGAHYISEEFAGEKGMEEAQAVATDCFIAIGVYSLFLLFCGYRVISSGKSEPKLLENAAE